MSSRERYYPIDEGSQEETHLRRQESLQKMMRERGLACYAKALGFYHTSSLIEFLTEGEGLVVDLGCGKGNFVKEVAPLVPNRYFLGIDGFISEESGSNWQLKKAFFEDLPLEDNSVDEMFSVMAFGYYAESPNQISQQISEIRRCLKKDGRLMTVVVPYLLVKPNHLWLSCDDILPDEKQYDQLALQSERLCLEEITCFAQEAGEQASFYLDIDFFQQQGLRLIKKERSIDTESTLGTVVLSWQTKG